MGKKRGIDEWGRAPYHERFVARPAPCHMALLARLTPIRLRSELLRRAAASEYARNACPHCKPFFRFAASNASLPGGPISPHVCFASVARGVTGRCCARRCDLAVRRPTSSLLPSPAAAARVDAAALLRLAAAFADARDACPSRSHDSPLATPRCPAGRSRPSSALRPSPRRRGALFRATLRSRRLACHITLLARLVPDRRLAKMRPALLRRATAS